MQGWEPGGLKGERDAKRRKLEGGNEGGRQEVRANQ